MSVLQLAKLTCVVFLLANIEQDLSYRCSLDRLGDIDVLPVQNCVAQTEVFCASKGGAQQMAKEMQVPFLGRVPLDPLLSKAAEEGKSAFAESQGRKFMPSLPALQAIIKEILQVIVTS